MSNTIHTDTNGFAFKLIYLVCLKTRNRKFQTVIFLSSVQEIQPNPIYHSIGNLWTIRLYNFRIIMRSIKITQLCAICQMLSVFRQSHHIEKCINLWQQNLTNILCKCILLSPPPLQREEFFSADRLYPAWGSKGVCTPVGMAPCASRG